jgi:hypothetical protein
MVMKSLKLQEHIYKFMKNAVSVVWCRLGLVRADVSEGSVTSIFRVERISELGAVLAITSS